MAISLVERFDRTGEALVLLAPGGVYCLSDQSTNCDRPYSVASTGGLAPQPPVFQSATPVRPLGMGPHTQKVHSVVFRDPGLAGHSYERTRCEVGLEGRGAPMGYSNPCWPRTA